MKLEAFVRARIRDDFHDAAWEFYTAGVVIPEVNPSVDRSALEAFLEHGEATYRRATALWRIVDLLVFPADADPLIAGCFLNVDAKHVVLLLAGAYADHPDYDPEWRLPDVDADRDEPREPDLVRTPPGVDPPQRRAGLGLPCPHCGIVSTGWSIELAEAARPPRPAVVFTNPTAVLEPCKHVVSRDDLDVPSTPTFPPRP